MVEILLQGTLFSLGAVGLYWGADYFVRGSLGVAASLGVSPLIVGLTIVAFGTSLPELVVSFVAVLAGNPGISFGNVVGSNIANIGLVLGVGALCRPVTVERAIASHDIPITVASAILLVLLSVLGNGLNRYDGMILLLLFGVFLVSVLRRSRRVLAVEEVTRGSRTLVRHLLSSGLGLALLLVGARLVVDAAVFFASEVFHVDEVLVGLTVVAVGTSLPELATSLMAAGRGHFEISLGNIVGSNIFNSLFIVGGVSFVRELAVSPGVIHYDGVTMLLFSVLLLRFAWSRKAVSRYEGLALIVLYSAYLGLVAWRATR